MLWPTELPGIGSSQQVVPALGCCSRGAWPAVTATDRFASGFCRPHHGSSQGQQLRPSASGRSQPRSLSTCLSDDEQPLFSLQRQRTGLSDWGAGEAAGPSAVASAVAHAERLSSHAEATTSAVGPPR